MQNCTLGFFFFLVLPFAGMSQTLSDLLKNPDICWVAKIEHDWVLDEEQNPKTELNYSGLLKWLQPQKLNYLFPNEFARGTILEAITSQQVSIFSDPECTTLIALNTLNPPDTAISVCNGDTFLIENQLEITDFSHFRVQALLYYDSKKACFGSTFISAAMMMNVYDYEMKNIGTKPFGWFKVGNGAPKNYKTDPNITLAIRTWSRSENNFLNMKNIKLLKAPTAELEPREHLFQLLASPKPRQKREAFYDYNDFPELKPLSLEERRAIVAWQDTTELYDYSTKQSVYTIESHQILPEDIHELRLVQTWYWDDRKKQLAVQLEAVAPLLDVKGADGEIRSKKPLFYRLSN